MMTTEIQFWRGRWQENRTGWDLGGPHPHLETLLDVAANYWTPNPNQKLINFLIPGCGRAHDGAAIIDRKIRLPKTFENKVLRLTATDFAPEAIDAARTLYGHLEQSGIEFKIADALSGSNTQENSKFDFIFDRAMLCALKPEDRIKYLTTSHGLLRENGLFLSIPFTQIDKNGDAFSGPPFEISRQSLISIMSEAKFACLHFEAVTAAKYPAIIKEEAITIWRKSSGKT